jgi:hypothetical protein
MMGINCVVAMGILLGQPPAPERKPDVVIKETDKEAVAKVGQTIEVRIPEPALGLAVFEPKAEVEGGAVGKDYEIGEAVDRTVKQVLFDGLFKTITFTAVKPGTATVTIRYERGSKKVERVIRVTVNEADKPRK